jgi:hypothetical protein
LYVILFIYISMKKLAFFCILNFSTPCSGPLVWVNEVVCVSRISELVLGLTVVTAHKGEDVAVLQPVDVNVPTEMLVSRSRSSSCM